VLEISGVEGEEHARAVAKFLGDAGVRVVVFQGIPPGTYRLAAELRRALPRLRILCAFHGSSAQHSVIQDESRLLDDILQLTGAGVFDGVGFLKEGMADVFKRLGQPAFRLRNKVRRRREAPTLKELTPGRVDIGVFVSNSWVKNLNTQVLAAMGVPDAVAHVTEKPAAAYLDAFSSRIEIEGLLPHDRFLERLGDMHVNSYVSLTECYPMTVLESLELGVPCLTSHTAPLFDDAEYLFDALVVTRHDDAGAILSKLEGALADREQIVRRGHEHVKRLNAEADALWNEFVHG
jgi:hypothetical protein